ncbi:hypothetical protein GCM10010327_40630 [Streptomyces nitrosporeus]|nr:hypothetical protein GCM10010327_40630 [Streptomyces nitrosporeus]
MREMGPAVSTVAKISARVCSLTSSENRILDGLITRCLQVVVCQGRCITFSAIEPDAGGEGFPYARGRYRQALQKSSSRLLRLGRRRPVEVGAAAYDGSVSLSI